MTKEQYLEYWRDSFRNFICGLISSIEKLKMEPIATDLDKLALDECKVLLLGKAVQNVERGLSEGVLTREMLDSIEKLQKDLVDIALKYVQACSIVRVFLKVLSYSRIEHEKEASIIRLNVFYNN